MMRSVFAAILAASLAFATSALAQSQDVASADDTARFLAGLPPSESSPLARLTQESSWKQHAGVFGAAFGKFESQQLTKIREWSDAHLKSRRQILYYLFSGPDFLYANAFFPNASTYVMAGLEPVGQIPELTKLQRGTVAQTLRNLEVSLSSILSVSYFITVNMRENLNSGVVSGTLPVLYVFLARSGKTIREVSFVNIDEQGVLQTSDKPGVRTPARGVKIVFSEDGGRMKTLYYFTTNLADEGKENAFLKYCRQQSRGDAFIKSASYLMHMGSFSRVRNFILDQSEQILQDDSGIPLSQFEAGKWFLHPYGNYVGTLTMFQEHYQPRLTELYQRKPQNPLDFGIGYQSRFSQSNLLLAIRNSGAADLVDRKPGDASRLNEYDIGGILAKRPPVEIGRSGVQGESKIY